MLKFLLYAFRWQLSTPILAPIVSYFKHSPSKFGTEQDWMAAAIANLIGACIFFWVDKFIFGAKVQEWEFMRLGKCADCGKYTAVRRLRYDPAGYDRRDDPDPEFRCNECSKMKLASLKLK
jgi:hypothetical protein